MGATSDFVVRVDWIGWSGLTEVRSYPLYMVPFVSTRPLYRLLANDRSDPYISVYEPPEPSHPGDLTTMRWRGFLPSSFVQSVLDTIL